MWKLTRPAVTAGRTYAKCIKNMRGLVRKARLQGYSRIIIKYSNDFDLAASNNTIHALTRAADADEPFVNDMTWVYEEKFVGGPGREVYNKIRSATGICPLCGHRDVATLDHHLPKSMYPALSVSPLNLVPACTNCNHIKLGDYPKTPEDQTIHPYFDDIENDLWLYGEVIKTSPVAVRFFVTPPANWSSIKKKRILRHFHAFELSELYSVQAARTIAGIRKQLSRLFDRGGANAVQQHLTESADSWADESTNSWQTATYKALSSSAWFCGGGFRADQQ